MSLINDALKRAHQAQKNQPLRAPSPPLQTADQVRRSSFSLAGLGLICGGLGLAGWFYFKAPEAAPPVPLVAASRPEPGQPVESFDRAGFVQASLPEQPPAPPPPFSQPARPPVDPPPPAALPPSPPAETQAAAPVVTSAPPAMPPHAARALPGAPFPELKLQGIFYRLKNPSVLINGRTVTNGDNLEGVTVLKIERESVLVEWNGATKVLRMESF